MIEQEKDFYAMRGHDRSDEARLEARVADLTGKLAEAEAERDFAWESLRRIFHDRAFYGSECSYDRSEAIAADLLNKSKQAFRQSRAGKGDTK